MSIDERLEALTMNLELTARDVADLQKAVAEMQKKTERFQQATDDRFAKWQLEKQHLDEKVDTLMDGIRMLLTTSEAHQARIERLERKVS